MSADSAHSLTDAQLLYEYLGRKIEGGSRHAAAEEVLADLSAYQEQLERLRAMVQQAEASLVAGRGEELDLEALLSRVRRRIEAEGRSK